MYETDVLDEQGLPSVAIVIPTLNEAAYIGRCLRSVEVQEGPFEIIVSDGGSSDQTLQIVGDRARIIQGDPERARQMNAGAAVSTATYLVFLHADTLLPVGALSMIRNTLGQPGVAGGCFRLRFDENHYLLRFYSWGTSVLKWHRLVFGDRTIFCTRSAFNRARGFPEQPIFEDLEFFCALKRIGALRYLPAGVVTAARRFSAFGYFFQQAKNLGLWLLYQFGASADRLSRFYPASNTPVR